MLSNRITLAVAHYYMSGTEANYSFEHGRITDIKVSYTTEFNEVARLITFKNLMDLANFIDGSTIRNKNGAWIEAECHNMGLYFLKSFRIGNMFIQQDVSGKFTCTSDNLYSIDLGVYSEYVKFYNQVKSTYYGVYKDHYEYILSQNNYPPQEDPRKYIDCGFIQTLFGSHLTYLIKLFESHKDDHNK